MIGFANLYILKHKWTYLSLQNLHQYRHHKRVTGSLNLTHAAYNQELHQLAYKSQRTLDWNPVEQ